MKTEERIRRKLREVGAMKRKAFREDKDDLYILHSKKEKLLEWILED